MSVVEKLFDLGNRDKAPTTGEVIQKLKDTEEMLIKKHDFLEKKIGQNLKIAKANRTKNKRVALQALKRKKRYQTQLQQIDGTLNNVELQREALESAKTNANILETMGVAAKALQSTHKNMDVDVLMDEIVEQQNIEKGFSDAIPDILYLDDDDEDDLLAELEELEQHDLDKQLLETGPTIPDNLPEVPTSVPVAARKKKEQEDKAHMAELAAWAS